MQGTDFGYQVSLSDDHANGLFWQPSAFSEQLVAVAVGRNLGA